MIEKGVDDNLELNNSLEELRKQILDASTYFDVLVQLWPTEKKVDIINRYKGFFLPIRKILFDQFSIKICNATSNDNRLPSFYQVFRLINTNPDLALRLDIRLLRKRLRKHKATLAAIEKYRNTKAAHWDITIEKPEQPPILFGECKEMLVECQNVFNEINGEITNGEWSFEYVQHNDASIVLDHLSEIAEIHKKRIDELMSKLDEHK